MPSCVLSRGNVRPASAQFDFMERSRGAYRGSVITTTCNPDLSLEQQEATMKTRFEIRLLALQEATKIAIARQAASTFTAAASTLDVVATAEQFEKFLLREGAPDEAGPGDP